ncbi:MAG: hypothetical protein AB1611_16565 [bacterium]
MVYQELHLSKLRIWRSPAFVIFLVFITIGCGSKKVSVPKIDGLCGRKTLVIEKVTQNLPRGYVEFFAEKDNNREWSFFIYHFLNNKKEWTGWTGVDKSRKTINSRFFIEPGLHTFIIKFEPLITGFELLRASIFNALPSSLSPPERLICKDKKVTVEVIDGMITPVKITLQFIDETWKNEFQQITPYYNFEIKEDVYAPISLENYNNFKCNCNTIVPVPRKFTFPSQYFPGPKLSYWPFNKLDNGVLRVTENSIEFEGKKKDITIMLSDIKTISYVTFGLSPIKWVSIEYGKEKLLSYALFSPGHKLSDRAFWAIKSFVKEKGLNPLIEEQPK